MLMVLPFIVWLPWDFPCFVQGPAYPNILFKRKNYEIKLSLLLQQLVFTLDVLAQKSYFCHRWGEESRFLRVPFNQSFKCLFSRGRKKIGSAVKGSFYVDGDSFYSPGVLIQMREAKVLGDRYLALQSKNVKCCCKAECKSFSLECFTVAVQFCTIDFPL